MVTKVPNSEGDVFRFLSFNVRFFSPRALCVLGFFLGKKSKKTDAYSCVPYPLCTSALRRSKKKITFFFALAQLFFLADES